MLVVSLAAFLGVLFAPVDAQTTPPKCFGIVGVTDELYDNAFDEMRGNASEAVNTLISNSDWLGLGTVTSRTEIFIVRELMSQVAPTYFTQEYLTSGRLQTGIEDKVAGYKLLVATFGADPECTVVFSDKSDDEEDAEAAGIPHFESVSDTWGFRPSDVIEAQAKMEGCACYAPLPPTPETA